MSVAAATSEAHPHGAGFAIEEPVTDENTRRELRRQLASASSSVDGIVTPADAEARGYVPVTLDLAFLGVHYLNPKYLDMPFSPKRPTHLIFDRDGPGGRMIGLMYYIHTPGDVPDGFVGPNDHWHNHRGACMANGLMLALDDVTEQSCTRLGGSLEPFHRDFAQSVDAARVGGARQRQPVGHIRRRQPPPSPDQGQVQAPWTGP